MGDKKVDILYAVTEGCCAFCGFTGKVLRTRTVISYPDTKQETEHYKLDTCINCLMLILGPLLEKKKEEESCSGLYG